MAITPGQNLISGSENDKKTNRRNLSFDPFVGATAPAVDSNFFSGLRDVATNLAFNVVDSALMGIPGRKLEESATTTRDGFFDAPRRTFGEAYDRLGIKPYEELSGAGKFGLGLGQAAGFFIPFSGISKATTAAQRLAFGNAKNLIGEAVKTPIKGLSTTNPLRSIAKNSLMKESKKIPHIYRSTPEQYGRFSQNLSSNMRKEMAEFAKNNGMKVGQSQIDELATGIIRTIEKMGNERRFVDNLPDMIGKLGMEIPGNIAPNVAGYVGRAIDQSANMMIYETVGHLARAAAGAEYEDVDYDLLDSMKHSAGFAAAISLADFIPGGRRAGAAQDFYRYSRNALKGTRDFSKLTDDQLRVMTAWYSKMGNFGKSSKPLEVGKNGREELIGWLKSTYNNNKRDLLRAIMKDGGKSVVGSLPRAAFDGLVTATYLNGTENFMDAIHDESMIGDYLVGAFMAMRAYQPLDPRKAMRWRYDNSIDSRFQFMESLGAGRGEIASSIRGMDATMRDIDVSARTLYDTKIAPDIRARVFQRPDNEKTAPEGVDSNMSSIQERSFADNLVTEFLPMFIKDENIIGKSEGDLGNTLTQLVESGQIPQPLQMSNRQFEQFWNNIKDIETERGSLQHYIDNNLDYNRFREDYQKPVVQNHADILYRSTKEFADEMGILISDATINGEKVMRVRNFADTEYGSDHVNFFLERVRDLEALGRVEIVRDQNGVENISNRLREGDVEQSLKSIAERYNEDSMSYVDSYHRFSTIDNPVTDYINSYVNLVSRNRFEDALLNRERPNDRNYEIIRDKITETLGDNIAAERIEISKGDLSEKQQELLPTLQKLVDSIHQMKVNVGRVASGERVKQIEFDDANDLFNVLKEFNIATTRSDGELLIGWDSIENMRDRIYERSLVRSGLTPTDFVAYQMFAREFGLEGGKLKLPSAETFRTAIDEQLRDENVRDVQDDAVDPLTKVYGEALERMRRTGLVETVNYSTRSNDKESLRDIVTTIQDIYSERSRAELSNLGESSTRESESYRSLMADLKIASDSFMNNPEKIADHLQKAKEIITEHNQAFENLKDIYKLDTSDILTRADDLVKDLADTPDKRDFLARLFSKRTVDQISDLADLSGRMGILANLTSSRMGFSPAMAKLRSEIRARKGDSKQRFDEMPLDKAFDEFIKEAGYDQAKALEDAVTRSLNITTNLDTNKLIGDVSTKEFMDVFRRISETIHRHNSQSLVGLFQRLGMRSYLNDKGTSFSDTIRTMLTDENNIESNVSRILKSIENKMGESEFLSQREDVVKSIVSSIGLMNRRNQFSPEISIEGSNIRIRKENPSAETPLGNFIEKSGLKLHVIKSSFVDLKGNAGDLRDGTIHEAQAKLNRAFRKAYDDKTLDKISDPKLVDEIFHIRENDVIFPVFVPLQANEDVGVAVSRSRENLEQLGKLFDGFYNETKNEVPSNRQAAFAKHFEGVRDGIREGNESAINAAVRGMYYKDNISKDLFYQMLGEGEAPADIALSSRLAQIKQFKYIHHVNNKNAMSYDSRTLGMIRRVTKESLNNVDKEILSELSRREKNGVRVFVFEDEGENSVTARDIVEKHVRQRYEKMNITDEAVIRRAINDTVRDYNMDRDADSISQSIFDGVTFASRASMKVDAFLMGTDFNDGATSAKMQFHNAEESFIGKTAVRHNDSLDKFMRDNKIDYIVPASSAKSWMNKDKINQINNWDTSKGIADNFSENFKDINEVSYRTFSPETVKYLYPTHAGKNLTDNTTTSAMHFMSRESLRDYTDQLNPKAMMDVIRKHVENSMINNFAGGIEGIFSKKYDGMDSKYSHYTAIEQLFNWGIHAHNGMVRGSVMRMIKNEVYGSLITQKKEDVLNSFLFAEDDLATPIYRTDGNRGYVKSFGEIRLPSIKENISLDSNTSYVFSLQRDNDFQDYVFSMDVDRKKLRINTPDRAAEDLPKHIQDAIQVVYKEAQSTETYGNANRFFERFDDVLSSKDEKYKNLRDAISTLREYGIGDFSLGVITNKIPKKFAPDSIVNRLKGFAKETDGNYIGVNSFEIAMQHQADQDGDKAVVYMKMPSNVFNDSMHNMALAKDAPTIAPDKSTFPNVFGNMTDNGNFGNRNESHASNNPLRYMEAEKKSKYIVGSTVKLQGSLTMIEAAGMKFNSNQLPSFRNSDDASFGTASDLARISGTMTQSILDAWGGVHDALVQRNAIKDFILFGDKGDIPTEVLNKTSHGDWEGIFKPPLDGFEAGTGKGRVFRDYVRTIYGAFEDVYSGLGDVYDGGVAIKPEFHHLARSYYNLKNIFSGDIGYVKRTLEMRYNRYNNKDALKALTELTTQADNPNNLSNIFSFDRSFTQLAKDHPVLNALDAIVRGGDFTKEESYNLHENPTLRKYFSIGDDGGTLRMESKISDSEIITQDMSLKGDVVDKMIQNMKIDKQPIDYSKLTEQKHYGLIKYAIRKKINQLENSRGFYRKIGETEKAGDLDYNIELLNNRLTELDKKVYSRINEMIKEGVVEDVKLTKTKGGFVNNTDNNVHVYQIKDGKYEFVKTLAPDKYTPKWMNSRDDFVVLRNPIEIQPILTNDAKEGYAMEMATADYANSMNADSINRIRNIIQNTKNDIRQINSDSFEAMDFSPASKNEIWDSNSNYSNIVMRKMLEDLEATGLDVDIITKAILSPNTVRGEVISDGGNVVNSFKNNNQFNNAFLRYVIENRFDATSDWFASTESVMRDFVQNVMVSNNINPTGVHAPDNVLPSDRIRQYNMPASSPGESLIRSMTFHAQDNPLVREAIKDYYEIDKRYNWDGSVTVKNRFEKKYNDELMRGCKL